MGVLQSHEIVQWAQYHNSKYNHGGGRDHLVFLPRGKRNLVRLDRFEAVINEYCESFKWSELCHLVALIAIELEAGVFVHGAAVTAYEEAMSILGRLGFALDIYDLKDELFFRDQVIEVISGERRVVSNFRRRGVWYLRLSRRICYECSRLTRKYIRAVPRSTEGDRVELLAGLLRDYFLPPDRP
jgi:hypothetical protein